MLIYIIVFSFKTILSAIFIVMLYFNILLLLLDEGNSVIDEDEYSRKPSVVFSPNRPATKRKQTSPDERDYKSKYKKFLKCDSKVKVKGEEKEILNIVNIVLSGC